MKAYKAVNGSVSLLFNTSTLRLPVLNGSVDQVAVASFTGSGQDQRRVCCGILYNFS